MHLPPGQWSSQRHWHSTEDEFCYVLEGEVWLVTDSEGAFADMRAALPDTLTVSMLYRDYLRTFEPDTDRTP